MQMHSGGRYAGHAGHAALHNAPPNPHKWEFPPSHLNLGRYSDKNTENPRIRTLATPAGGPGEKRVYLEGDSFSPQESVQEEPRLPQPGQSCEKPEAVVRPVDHLLQLPPLVPHLRHRLVRVTALDTTKLIIMKT